MAFSKPRRAFGDPVSEPAEAPHYEPIPRPAPNLLEMPLSAILPGINQAVERAGRLVFHSVGDTGGIAGTEMQERWLRPWKVKSARQSAIRSRCSFTTSVMSFISTASAPI